MMHRLYSKTLPISQSAGLLDAIPAGARFGTIMADPPIAFATRSPKGEGRSPQQHYSCMPLAELEALPIAEIAAADCFLFLWVPLRSMFLVEPLTTAWGFRFSGSAFVWAKLNKSGDGWFMGNGFSTRKNVEVCWLGRRGSPKRKSKSVRELIIAPRREHSRKPDEIYARIEALCGGPYVELWARQRRPNWTAVGDELGKFSSCPR
jgi:N6-adenosine-specific RNA methylase IME4